MNITIRKEQTGDYIITENVIKSAFASIELSDKKEHELVARIRKSDVFNSELSLVAINEDNNELVGHILLSNLKIRSDHKVVESLALAPISVLPSYQNKGIGKLLINEALKSAKVLGYHSVVVLGHPTYYQKFGFIKASLWGIKAPFDVPDEAFMVLELTEGTLPNISGIVEYPSVFLEEGNGE